MRADPDRNDRTRAGTSRTRRVRPTSERAVRAQSPYSRFRRDHMGVLSRLERLETALPHAPGWTLREEPLRALLAHLDRQFATHMAAEEAVLYPVLQEVFPEAAPSLRPLHEEHAELRTMLSALAETLRRPPTASRDDQVVVQVRDFAELLRLHIRKEESLVFDLSERVLDASELRGLERRLAPFVPANAPPTRSRRLPRSRPS